MDIVLQAKPFGYLELAALDYVHHVAGIPLLV